MLKLKERLKNFFNGKPDRVDIVKLVKENKYSYDAIKIVFGIVYMKKMFLLQFIK